MPKTFKGIVRAKDWRWVYGTANTSLRWRIEKWLLDHGIREEFYVEFIDGLEEFIKKEAGMVTWEDLKMVDKKQKRGETKVVVLTNGVEVVLKDVVKCIWDDGKGCVVFSRKDGSRVYIMKNKIEVYPK